MSIIYRYKIIEKILDLALGKNREGKDHLAYCSCSGKWLFLVIKDNMFRLAIVAAIVATIYFMIYIGSYTNIDVLLWKSFIVGAIADAILIILEYFRE